MNYQMVKPFTINVINFTMIEKLSNGAVFVEVERGSFGTWTFETFIIHLAIQFYDDVLTNSRDTLQKMAIDVAFPLSASTIEFTSSLRQLFVRCSNRRKYEARRDDMALKYPIDIHSNNIKHLEKIKTLSTLALSTNACFSLDEILSLNVKRLEINQFFLTVGHLNSFIKTWCNGNLEFEGFTFLGVDLVRPLRIDALFENLVYQKSDHFEESMDYAISRYRTRRNVAFYRIKSLDEKRTMKVKLMEKRVELELF